jgi:HEAT repeat protein
VIGIALSLLLLGGIAVLVIRNRATTQTTVVTDIEGDTRISDPNVARLAKQLSSRTIRERTAAAKDLAAMGPRAREAIPALLKALSRKGAAIEFTTAVSRAIKAIGVSAIPDYIDYLESGDPGIRFSAAQMLGSFGEKAGPAVDALVEVLENDEDMNVRLSAASALGRIGRAAYAAVPALRRVRGSINKPLTGDPEAELRARAQAALNQITMQD